jgi:hypothetical protein
VVAFRQASSNFVPRHMVKRIPVKQHQR